MRRATSLLHPLALAGALACAGAPPPRALTDLDALAKSPRSAAAEQLAPQAYRHARELTAQAHTAHERGETEIAGLLAEQAQAQFEQAFALARAAKADARRAAANEKVTQSKAALAAIDAQQAELGAESEALELRARVIRDALPLAPSGRATPEREQARKDVARSLITDARLLCVAAQLLGGETEQVKKALENVGALERKVDQGGIAPVDDAVTARSSCLSLLSTVRRTNEERSLTPTSSKLPPVDVLLDALSRAGHQPHRDDRGVIVTLRESFDGNELSAKARQRLGELALVARTHERYPLLLVLHSARGRATAADGQRLAAAQRLLSEAGLKAVRAELAGGAQPLVPPARAGSASENARLEVVFVAPVW